MLAPLGRWSLRVESDDNGPQLEDWVYNASCPTIRVLSYALFEVPLVHSSPAPQSVIRFGLFEADLTARELRKRGRKIPLQDQPFRVLALLVNRPGELIPREDFQKALWPGDTFVEFDEGLNKAIQKLRLALDDSSDNPRFIETLPRKGYRFIAPVGGGAGKTTAPETPPNSTVNRWQWISAAAIATVILVLAVVWLRVPARVPGRSEWVQLTNFPDSVSQPALSPDGRMLTFVRGPATFYTSGQIYVKLLPDGEPKQLTHDNYQKMSPVFSLDGSRIAYTTVDDQFKWDTWTIPALGGEARRWLPNASGLVWRDLHDILFSEMKDGTHMAIVTSGENRLAAHDVYVPPHEQGMAHRSYPSPDGKWLLVVEMDGPWIPCRLVPLDGSSIGRQVGPPDGACTFAAWSPDGTWMYFSSSAGGAFHTWRQRFPNGKPEQITSGPTEEEGVAMAPDGRSFIAAVGQAQRPVNLHDPSGERQILLEGYGFQPKFAPDHRTVYYRLLKGSQPASDPTELWVADVVSGRNEPLLPGLPMRGLYVYDISPDGTELVLTSRNQEGRDRLWLAPLDRKSPPREIPNIEGITPVFGLHGEIFFRAADGFVYKIREDGTGLRKLIEKPISLVTSMSPDGRWLIVEAGETYVHPIGGGPLFRLGGTMNVGWTPDRRHMWISVSDGGMRRFAAGNTYVIPLPPGKMLPNIPEGGFHSRREIAALRGVHIIDAADVAFGRSLDVYSFSRETTQRNLFRIPLP